MNDRKKSEIVFNMEFTTSKLLAYFIAIAATLSGILLESSEVLIVGWTISAALSGVKVMADKKKNMNSEAIDKNKEILNG